MKCNLKTTVPAIALLLMMSACNDNDDKEKDPSELSTYKGVWIEPGAGRAIDIQANSVEVYNYSRQTCSSMHTIGSLEQAKSEFTQIRKEGSNGFSMVLSGGTEFDRIQLTKTSLPEACNEVIENPEFDPEFVFEHTWHMMNDYYPFFNQRKVDWLAQYNRYKPLISESTSEESLFEVVSEMLSPLNDGHIQLNVESDNYENGFSAGEIAGWYLPVYSSSRDGEIDFEEASADYVETFTDILFAFNAEENISEKIARSKLAIKSLAEKKQDDEDMYKSFVNSEGDTNARWGVLKGNIGYFQLNSLDGFAVEDSNHITNSAADLSAFDNLVDQVMSDLSETSSLILDIRFNGGGRDELSLALANRFADQERVVASKQNYNLGDPALVHTLSIVPHTDGIYSNPVHMITGPMTASAAEILTMAMQVLPQVTLIGESTEGIFSDILDIQLTPDWQLGISYQEYFSPDGTQNESLGIAPSIEVTTTAPIAFNSFAVFPAINEVFALYGQLTEIGEQDFNQAVSQVLDDTGIPGLAVTWIDDENIMASEAIGYADVEAEIPVTANTPFNLGSVSKTFIGVAAAQMVEKELIEIDTSLADIDLGFEINSPYFDSDEINLQQLVTHTSGIIDGDNYLCSYFFIEDQSSVLNAFQQDESCDEPLAVTTSSFMNEYLSESGLLYEEDNFAEALPGEHYEYSNVAAALTSEVLASVSGTSFSNWTELNIFTPLAMNSSHWFNSDYSPDDIKPAKRYFVNPDGLMEVIPEFALATWADGGLKSSANDMARYLLAIVNGGSYEETTILQPETVEVMLNPLTEHISDEGGAQGAFWVNNGLFVGHNGSDPGTDSELRFDSHNDFGFIVMTNGNDVLDIQAKEFEFARIYLNHLVYYRGLTIKNEQAAR